MKVLIVDDEQIERETIRFFLSRRSSDIEIIGEASCGLEAVAKGRLLRPDALLMDIEMGQMNGLEACALIKAESPHTEIVILTAFGRFEYSRQALRCGVFDYLLKPIREEELFDCLHRLDAHICLKRTVNFSSESVRADAGEPDSPIVDNRDSRIREIARYIHAHLDAPLSLETMADLIHTTPEYLSRMFKAKTGTLLSRFILESRLSRAKLLLKWEEDKPLKQIAKEVGFSSVQHFSNTFKKYERVTPAQYREKGRP